MNLQLASVVIMTALVVNVSGSLAIGLLTGAARWHGLGPTWLVVTATGFCGGYTTFSTAMIETVRLIEAREWRWAAVHALGGLAACVGAAAVGMALMWAAS